MKSLRKLKIDDCSNITSNSIKRLSKSKTLPLFFRFDLIFSLPIKQIDKIDIKNLMA